MISKNALFSASLWFLTIVVAAALGAVLFWKRNALPIPNVVKSSISQAFALGSGSKNGKAGGDSKSIATILLPLSSKTIRVPDASRGGGGGGITSYEDRVILLRHDGQLYSVHPKAGAEALPIAPPSNGFEAYVKAAEGRLKDGYQHRFDWFRYVDVEYFKRDETHGLLAGFVRYDDANTCVRTIVSKLELPIGQDFLTLKNIGEDRWTDVFQSEPCLPLKTTRNAIEGHMGGGKIVLAPDGESVFVAVGDYHWDGTVAPRNLPEDSSGAGRASVAQDLKGDYGKIIRNNFVDGTSEQVSRGHRNPQGLSLDKAGRLWALEHGPFGGDELNLIVPGQNYGWPEVTLGDPTYTGKYSVNSSYGSEGAGRHDGFVKPVMSWSPAIAPSGLTLIEGFHPAWDGDLLATTLTTRSLVRLRVNEKGGLHHVERIAMGVRLRDLTMLGDSLAVWTENATLMFLSPAASASTAVDPQTLFTQMSGPAVQGATRLLQRCTECHSLGAGQNVNAPSLGEFYNAGMGATAFANYSDALRSDQRGWTPELLAAYIADPASVVPGTSMPSQGELDPDELEVLVTALIKWNEKAISGGIEERGK